MRPRSWKLRLATAGILLLATSILTDVDARFVEVPFRGSLNYWIANTLSQSNGDARSVPGNAAPSVGDKENNKVVLDTSASSTAAAAVTEQPSSVKVAPGSSTGGQAPHQPHEEGGPNIGVAVGGATAGVVALLAASYGVRRVKRQQDSELIADGAMLERSSIVAVSELELNTPPGSGIGSSTDSGIPITHLYSQQHTTTSMSMNDEDEDDDYADEVSLD